MFNVYKIDDAKQLIYEKYKNINLETEKISVTDACGRVLATDVTACDNVPHFNRSTVDGYAIKSVESQGASESMPIMLDIIGKIEMGEANTYVIENGECMYVPTGGMLPKNCDSVVMIENTEKINDTVAVYKSTSSLENVLSIASDVSKGELIFSKGRRIREQDIGVLTAVGIKEVTVFKKIRVSILSTGDEIINPNEELLDGKIRDVNTYTLSALINKYGGEVVCSAVVSDDENILKNEVINCINISDIVLISGGSSVGTKDYTYKIMDSIGDVFIHGLAIKPGKPTIFGKASDKILIGLPGQVASAFIVANIFIPYIFTILTKSKEAIKPYIQAKLSSNVVSAPGRKTYKMVTLRNNIAEVVQGKSGMITLLTKADGYFIIEENDEGKLQDEIVKVYLF